MARFPHTDIAIAKVARKQKENIIVITVAVVAQMDSQQQPLKLWVPGSYPGDGTISCPPNIVAMYRPFKSGSGVRFTGGAPRSVVPSKPGRRGVIYCRLV